MVKGGEGERVVRGWKELYSWGSWTYHMVTLSLGAAQLSSKVQVGASGPQLGQGLKCEFRSVMTSSPRYRESREPDLAQLLGWALSHQVSDLN